MKLPKLTKPIITIIAVAVVLAIVGTVGALNGWFGGGAAIPEDTMTRGLVGYWNMDEGSGTKAYDASGNNNNGTLTNGPKWTKGKVSGGLSFDGTDDYVYCGTNLLGGGNISSFTIEAWIKTSINNGAIYVITPGEEVVFGIHSNHYLASIVDGAWQDPATTAVDDGLWHHVVLAIGGGVSTFYVDGKLDGSDASTPVFQDNLHRIGFASTFSYFNGTIDEVRIYNRALSAEEVRYHYNRGAPVAHWRFDEGSGTSAYDSTENNNDLTLVATPSWVSGKYGSAIDLEKDSSQYGYKPDTASLSITKDLTISAWLKPESITDATLFDIAGKWDGTNESYLLAQYGDEIRMYIDASANYKTTDALNLSTATWYYITAVYNSTAQTVTLYSNAIPITGTVSGTIPSSIGDDTGRFQIGAEDSSGTAANFYDGIIDDVRVYNYQRTADEIRLDYNAGLATHLGPSGKTCSEDPAGCMDYDLVGYWGMDEGAGTKAYDASGNSNNGTLTNGPKWTKGKVSGGLSFDGTDDYVNVLNSTSLIFGTNDFAVEIWAIRYSTASLMASIAKGYAGIGQWQLYYPSAGNIAFYADNGTITTGSISLIDTVWHHIVFTRYGDNGYLYINGILKKSLAGIDNADLNTAFKLSIGARGQGDSLRFNGTIDEVRIYNRALSAEEIRYHYNRGGPVVEWNMDEGSGTKVYDSSGNKAHADFPAASENQPTWSTP